MSILLVVCTNMELSNDDIFKARAKDLLLKELTATVDDNERHELDSIIRNQTEDSFWENIVFEIVQNNPIPVSTENLQPVLDNVLSNIARLKKTVPVADNKKPPVLRHISILSAPWLRYAAAIVLLAGVAIWLLLARQNTPKAPVHYTNLNEVQPGTNKAVLTLSDGTKIILDDSANQSFTDQNVAINKQGGVVKYNTRATPENAVEAYNVMHTPRGGQYQLVLPDGSEVWLNSASTLKYPTVFNGKNRQVELSGEGYFNVTPNKSKPFVVKLKKMEVTVLGTAFNVSAYDDEPEISTTLVEGSVKIRSGNDSVHIKPGQQAWVLNSSPSKLSVNGDVDVNTVLAWQRGLFVFSNADLAMIARQLRRWYDVEVRVQPGGDDLRFGGGITKKTSLDGVLKVLKANGIESRFEKGVLTLYTK